MIPGKLAATIGAAALGVGLVFGGTAAVPAAFAQETPQTVETQAQDAQRAEFEALRAEAYDSFVAALASELNVDEAAVDAAIRGALKEQIAAQEAAGRLDAGQVAELQATIDADEAPLFLGMGGPGGFGGRGRMHGFDGGHGGFFGPGGHRGPQGGFEGMMPDLPEGIAPPPAPPSADDESGQSVPVPVQPSENRASI